MLPESNRQPQKVLLKTKKKRVHNAEELPHNTNEGRGPLRKIPSGEVRACACIKHLVQYVRGSPISWQLSRLLQEQQPELQRQSEEQRIRPEHSAGSFSVPSQPDP